MNPQFEKELEASVGRELHALGELSAPPALANQIMRLIAQRSAAPWYRRAWPEWPVLLRAASLTVLLGAFGGLCLGAWELTQAGSGLMTESWLADLCALWRTSGVLAKVGGSIISGFGTGAIVTGLALIFAACVACIGLGSACVHLAMRSTINKIES